MKTAVTRLLSLALVLSFGGLMRAQPPTPFGTPSLLPIEDHYAQWQSNQVTYPPTRAVSPGVVRPASLGPAPSTYYDSSSAQMQYAAARLQALARPGEPANRSIVRPQIPIESAAPVPPQTDSTTNDNWMNSCNDGSCWGEACCDPCCEPCCPCYYASVGGLWFTRQRPRFSQISFDDTDPVGQVLSTDTGLGRWDPGAMVQIGRYLGSCHALELTYWGIYADGVETTVYASDIPGNMNTVFDLRPLNIGPLNANDLFDAAQAHRIRRDYDVNNAELNLVCGRMPWTGCTGCRVSYLAGFRYLRFTEGFYYASANTDWQFGVDPSNEAYYDIDVRNNLWGFQVGGRADWFVTSRFSIYTAPKFGIYANYMEHNSRIYNADGTAEVGPGNPLAGGVYDIASDKTITSFIGEIDLGINYQITSCLGASLGYRALAVSGLAYATDQIPASFGDLPGVATIDSNANMILHGGYAAVTMTW